MIGLLVASAFAAPPPDLDLEAVEPWERGAEALLNLPGGCWEWVGRASWSWDNGRFGASSGETAFAGRTNDGTWSSVHLEPLGETVASDDGRVIRVYDAQNARFAPLFGSLAGGRVRVSGGAGDEDDGGELEENAEASNVLRDVLDRIGGDAVATWAQWDEARGGVVLHRTFPVEKEPTQEIAVAVFFPGGGTRPTTLDVTFPAEFKHPFGGGPFFRWKIRDAKIAMRAHVVNDRIYPSSEAFSFDAKLFGFEFSGAQTIQYRHAARCPVAPAPAAPAPAPAPATTTAPPPAPVAAERSQPPGT
jgi:hypothetical protein